MGNQCSSKILKSGCILIDLVALYQLRNHDSEDARSKSHFLAGMLFTMGAEGNLLQIQSPCQILRNKKGVWDDWSNRQRVVEVFSDSVLSLEMQAMNMQEVKFTERWNEHLECCQGSAKGSEGKHTQFIFHLFPGAKTNENVFEIVEWIRQGQGGDGQ